MADMSLAVEKRALIIVSAIFPGFKTPGYYLLPYETMSPIGVIDNSPAIDCRVAETMIKAMMNRNAENKTNEASEKHWKVE